MTSVWLGSNGSNDSNDSIKLRFLCPSDVPKVKQLCCDWFPIEYPDSWYEEITSNPKFFALAAVFHLQIVGLIVAEIKLQIKCNREDQGLLSTHCSKSSRVVYILTLGVVKEFRRNGIATLLLDHLIIHLTRNPTTNDCKAIYLHVLTTNTIAIRFYENRQFRKHLFLPLYYSIDSIARDGFSYVLYINGGRPQTTLIDYLSPLYTTLTRISPCKWSKRLLQVIASILSRVIPMCASHKSSSQHLATC